MFFIIDDLMTGGPVPACTLSTQMVLLSASSLMVILSMLSRPPTSLNSQSDVAKKKLDDAKNRVLKLMTTSSPGLEVSKV